MMVKNIESLPLEEAATIGLINTNKRDITGNEIRREQGEAKRVTDEGFGSLNIIEGDTIIGTYAQVIQCNESSDMYGWAILMPIM